MNEIEKEYLATVFARRFLEYRDIIGGITLARGYGILTLSEMCEIGRMAITLIEEGKVT